MIPKIIHYCWFGGNPLDPLSEKCIASWRKFCPEYEIRRWDESNYDFTKNAYMRSAYEHKKWSFVSDYARLDIVYQHGGIYLDTDVELLRPLDELLNQPAFMGIEYSLCVATGLGMGAEPGIQVLRELRDTYDTLLFEKPDGTLNMVPCGYYQTQWLAERGFRREDMKQSVAGITIYPTTVLASRDWYYGTLKTTPETITVHHGAATWLTPEQQALRTRQHKLVTRFGRHLGGLLANGLRLGLYVQKNGVRSAVHRISGMKNKEK